MKTYMLSVAILALFLLSACEKEEPIPNACNITYSGYSIDKNYIDNDTSSFYYFRTILTATFAVKTRRYPPPGDPCAGDFQCESCWMSAWNTTFDTVRCDAVLGDTLYHLVVPPMSLIHVTDIPGFCDTPNMDIYNFEYF